jgi:GDP-L-fucose synthase
MKIYVAGHRGLVGSALVRKIESSADHTWVGRTRAELNLLDRASVLDFLSSERPDAVIIAAAKVGGIQANSSFPVEFLSENLQIETNLLDGSHLANVERVLFLGSSCVYPKFAKQPIKEEALLTGELEETNEAYALAKISGLKLVQAYRKEYGRSWISVMPTNLYGPGDNFDASTSHVLPALIRKFHEAKIGERNSVTLWGTGKPLREFLHADDLADACLFLLENYDGEIAINIGSGAEISISELAATVKRIVGFTGQIEWDLTKPDGTPRKLLNIEKLNDLGWHAKVDLSQGIELTYLDFLKHANL